MKTTVGSSSRVNTVPCTATKRQCIPEMAPLPVNRKILVYLYLAVSEAPRHRLTVRLALNLSPAQNRPFRCLHETSLPPFPTVALVPLQQRRTLQVSAWLKLSTKRQERLGHHPTIRHQSCKERCLHKRPLVLRQSVLVLPNRKLQPLRGLSHLAHVPFLRQPTRHRQAMRQVSVRGERTVACGET